MGIYTQLLIIVQFYFSLNNYYLLLSVIKHTTLKPNNIEFKNAYSNMLLLKYYVIQMYNRHPKSGKYSAIISGVGHCMSDDWKTIEMSQSKKQ